MSFVGDAIRAVAGRWGVTEGQVYTAVIGTVIAVAAAIGGIAPTLAERRVESTDIPRTTRTTSDFDEDPRVELDVGDLPRFELALPSPFGGGASPTTALTPATPGALERAAVGSFQVLATVPEPGAPQGIAAAPDGRVLVATNNGPERGVNGKPVLFVFDGDDAPARVPLNAVAAGQGVHDLVLPPGGNGRVVYALASKPAAVLRINVAERAVSTHATIPDIPSCVRSLAASPCELSPVDNAPRPIAATFDDNGAMFVADASQGVIWRIGSDRAAKLFLRAREFVSLDGLSGIAAAPNGVLYLTVAQVPTAANSGVVYRLVRGALTEVARADKGDLPRGLAVARSGKLYVALAGAGRILILNRDGSRAGFLPTDAASSFDTPMRVTFGPTALLVVEQAPTRPRAGRVVALGVDDAA